jgi:transcriptional regulator GlxA family with amidase domain
MQYDNETLRERIFRDSTYIKPVREPEPVSRTFAIFLCNGFSLFDIGIITEIFRMANSTGHGNSSQSIQYAIQMISVPGGAVTSTSSLLVHTRSESRHPSAFDAIFIACDPRAPGNIRDESLLDWIDKVRVYGQRICLLPWHVHTLDSAWRGKTILSIRDESVAIFEWADPFETALAFVEQDLGPAIARHIATQCLPEHVNQSLQHNDAGCASASEKVKAAARWLKNNAARDIRATDAASIAAMSVRNFLRHFRIEVGVAPAEYLRQARLEAASRLLIETNLPVDIIARRCGMKHGDQLGKAFRRYFSTSPTHYREDARQQRANTAGS